MRKKPKIKYTDMAIYVDNNILNPDADVSLIYNYLQMLAYMLAVKRRFFNKEEFCYPSDFFWINKDAVKENMDTIKKTSGTNESPIDLIA